MPITTSLIGGLKTRKPAKIILPVYGLYDGYTNIVRLTYRFLDGSLKQAVTMITTATFDDPADIRIRRSCKHVQIAQI